MQNTISRKARLLFVFLCILTIYAHLNIPKALATECEDFVMPVNDENSLLTAQLAIQVGISLSYRSSDPILKKRGREYIKAGICMNPEAVGIFVAEKR